MLEDLFRRPRVQRRIRQNPHGSVLEQFAEYLSARRHSLNTVHQYVFAAVHFCRWLGGRKIDRNAVSRFIHRHLPSCRCKTPAPRRSANLDAALNRLLEMIGADAAAPARKSPADSLLRRYAAHLTQVQGLAAATVHYRLRYARSMLSHFRFHCLGQLKQWTVKVQSQHGTQVASHVVDCSGNISRLSRHRRSCYFSDPGPAFFNYLVVYLWNDGYRESEQSWKALLLDVKVRGLIVDAKLATGDARLWNR